jgi:hypothetical protein
MTRIEVQMKLAENPKWNILKEKLMYDIIQQVEKFNTQWNMARNCTNKQTNKNS